MSEASKLLAIIGSPRPNGMTSRMVRCAVKAADEAGWQTDLICLYEKQIAYCTGCRACLLTGQCVQKDDLDEIAGLLQKCDAVILGAPVYWANIPAAVKNLFDRLLGTAMEETPAFPKPRLSPHQKYLLFTACHTPYPFSALCGQTGGAFRSMNEFFKTSGMKCLGRIACPNTGRITELPPAAIRNIERCVSKLL